jgi:hypothetical protein
VLKIIGIVQPLIGQEEKGCWKLRWFENKKNGLKILRILRVGIKNKSQQLTAPFGFNEGTYPAGRGAE